MIVPVATNCWARFLAQACSTASRREPRVFEALPHAATHTNSAIRMYVAEKSSRSDLETQCFPVEEVDGSCGPA